MIEVYRIMHHNAYGSTIFSSGTVAGLVEANIIEFAFLNHEKNTTIYYYMRKP